MPLTAAERQRRYREKLKLTNPEKFQQQKKKNSEKTLEKYKNKTANYSEEQKEQRRIKWREDRKKKDESLRTQQPAAESSKQRITKTLKKFELENTQLKRKLTVMMKGFINLQKKVQRQQVEIESLNKKYDNVIMKLELMETKANDQKETENITYYMDSTITDETPNKRVTVYKPNDTEHRNTQKRRDKEKVD